MSGRIKGLEFSFVEDKGTVILVVEVSVPTGVDTKLVTDRDTLSIHTKLGLGYSPA